MNRKITTKREDRSGSIAERQRDTGKVETGRPCIARTLTAALAALLLPLLVPLTAYAGDINSAEQSILSAISEQQEYQGAYYKVTDGYRAKVEEYLSRDDIDMSRREADDYIAQFHANIGVGVSAGYMEKVGDAAGADPGTGDGTGADNGAGTSGGTGAGTGGSGGTGTGTNTGDGAGSDDGAAAGTGTENKNGTENGTAGAAGTEGTGAAGTAGAAAILGTDPEGDGPVVDNTTGSTAEGPVEYVVLPMEEQTMYVQGIETLSVHEEAYKDSPVIGEVKEGEPVKVTGGASTGWAQIAYGEKTGYVSAAYLRTQGFMDRKEAEKKAEEEAKKAEEEKAAEEARKAEAAKKAEEEARKAEEEAAAQAEAEAEAAQAKDYSDAKPVENSINLGMIALAIVAVCIVGLGGVLFWHKKKSRSGKR
ncbi:MAG: SH3 domain-containing protein [Lachnospiraceae bacterium]